MAVRLGGNGLRHADSVKRRVIGLRRAGAAFIKSHPWFWARYRGLRAAHQRLLFRWHSRGTLDQQLITFEAFTGHRYGGSPRAIYEAMISDQRFAGCRFAWSFRDPRRASGIAALADSRTEIVPYRTARYYRTSAQARVWVSNSIMTPEVRPRHGQTYLQTWHGTPLKRIGLDIVETTEIAGFNKAEIDRRYRSDGAKITTFLSSAPFTTKVFAGAFGLPAGGHRSPFVEIGQPRNDALVNAGPDEIAAVRAKLGIPAGTKVMLYAPTWRDDQHDSRSGYVFTQPLDIARLHATLGQGWLLLFRAHYLVTNTIDFAAHGDFVRDVSGVDDINELCLASDVLITDYSSIYFDYALLDRPMVFYMYDLARYGARLRGFYLPVEDVPGPIATNQDELEAALLAADLAAPDTLAARKRAELVAEFAPHDDGHATARVLDLLAEDLGRSGHQPD